ncbi:pilus assembly protein [Roseomonas sp. PWR1]|uniref:Pilus assembly protein n=1 Tax=Roseomonas nitratireducens TaxID=2820810 RepID=A0ABS4APL6_9PROT|nr:TadE/TadG family type IV pilus assembly protein [Neoroseomonas nitratireducens]MBP0463207.1 pilus assembly protein [Neoroseomonas nitratireducens]
MTRRGRRGTVLLEFALTGPLLFALTMTVMEGAWQALTSSTLDIGAREASRFGATGSATPSWLPPPAPTSREEAIRRIVLHYGPYVIDQNRLTVRVTAYAGPSALAQPAPGTVGAGGAGETVLYEVSYDQPFLTPFPTLLLGRSVIEHRTRMIVRNEPFPSS